MARININCQHIDNYDGCRIHKPKGILDMFLTKILSKGRPTCILTKKMPQRDGEWICEDQLQYRRPTGGYGY